MSADKRNINDLIALIERNKVAQGYSNWHGPEGRPAAKAEEEEEDAVDEDDNDYSDVRLLIFATEGPFTESLFPMLDQHELVYAVTDVQEELIDIAIANPQIRHVLIDLDRPTNPAKGMNIFADLKMLNPNILIYYCTKSPMSMESRNIQTKGAKLMQKPVLRKIVDQFVAENFHH
ncbi:MAG: hypothetical protein LBC70_04345 [Chitinispirillales bacterium]|jgi:hypothetical protein|nr:hypothetical protein [Chitinispirillales bacterium]